MWKIILALLFLLAYFIRKNIIICYNYWQEKGVQYITPVYFFGNFAKAVFRLVSVTEALQGFYETFPNARYVGVYQFTKPFLLVRDPELIRKITVKDFEYFPDHTQYVPPDLDPLWGLNVFSLSVKDGWHNMRATLSPSFTSSKMRIVFKLMQECAKEYVNYLNTQGDKITLELKDTFTRFGNDVIGSAAFGVTCNSLRDRDNEFYLMGKEVSNFSGIRGWIFFAHTLFPKLMRFLKVRIIPTRIANFFKTVITETIRYRAEKNVIRPDMIHLLTEARKDQKQDDEVNELDSGFSVVEESDILRDVRPNKLELTDEVVTAQALGFFLAGFETVSTAMAYMFYQIAIDPVVQEKLYKEIRETVGCTIKGITYEQLLSMKYLDCTVAEALRLHPPLSIIDRKSAKPYLIKAEKPGEKPLHLDKNSIIWIPVRAIHRDPQYYYDPEKFIPERFSSENKHKINPFCYMPFGAGPRNCIGSRFALLECKLIIVEVMRRYELIPVEKTEIPITLCKTNTSPLPKNGLWIGLNRRK